MNRFLSFVNDIIFKNEQTKRILERPHADMYYIHELCSTVCKLGHDVGSQHVIENFALKLASLRFYRGINRSQLNFEIKPKY